VVSSGISTVTVACGAIRILPVPGTLRTSQGDCVPLPSPQPVNSFSCNLQTLAPGATVRLSVQYTVPSSTTDCNVDNVVNVVSSVYDPNTCNNDASDVNAVLERAELSITKVADVDQVRIGDITSVHTYTITVTNNGPSTAHQVTVSDTWPLWLVQFQKSLIAAPVGGCVTTGGDFTCAFGSVRAGHAVTATIQFTLSEKAITTGIISNTAVAFSPTDTKCRNATDTILVVSGQRSRAEGAEEAEAEQIWMDALSIPAHQVANSRIVRLNLTNTHRHDVEIKSLSVDDVEVAHQNAVHCFGALGRHESRACSFLTTASNTPKSVRVNGVGLEGRPLLTKSAVRNLE